jgi:endonuclease/exonuclease/phosphatase family metal-dependent hydrolase
MPASLQWAIGFALVAMACSGPLRRPLVIGPSGPIALAVITWNMHAGAGDLPRLVSDLASGQLTGTPPHDYALLLQEAVTGTASDPSALARDRQLSIMFEPVRSNRGRTTGNAILATQPLANTRTISLPRQRQPRAALSATLGVAGVQLFLVNAHLENRVSLWRGLLFSDGPRGRQAEALVAQLPDGPGIAGGDLNTWLGANEPAWRVFATRFPDTPADDLTPTFRDRLVLDHLFFDLPEGWRVQRRVLAETYGSDHRPVIGVITTSF